MNKLNFLSFGFLHFASRPMGAVWGALGTLWITTSLALAQPMIVSIVPPTTATGISSTSSVVFTFNAAMDTNRTIPTFYTPLTTPYYYTMSNFWNATSNVLTCSPVSPFMVPAQVWWNMVGYDISGNRLQAPKVGYFNTSDTVGSGSGTNAFTTFVIGRADLYSQSGTAQPTPDVVEPFIYLANTTLASNRTTTGITLTFPGGGVSNLVQNLGAPENYVFGGYMTNEATLETNFPPGNYTFTVNSSSSNETKVVAFPASLVQPGAPHIANLLAAQTVDSTQPFTLKWDLFAGGTASDYIVADLTTNWQSPSIGASNALDGTSTSVTVPAGIFAPGKTYSASVGFSHAVLATNGTEAIYVYRSTITQFVITTKPATVTAPPVLSNGAWSGGTFGFDLLTTAGQTVTVVSTNNAVGPLASWPILLTISNSPGTPIHITDPHSVTNPVLFYRARTGN